MTDSGVPSSGLSRIVLLGSAVVFGLIGVGFVFAPDPLAAAVDIDLTTVTAHNDFRAVYGGVPGGLAVFLVMAARRPGWAVPGLWVVLVTLGGLALSRLLSWGIDGWPTAIAFGLHAAEIFGCALAGLALRGETRRVDP